MIVSALRRAARRDEQEIALAAPLRKASDDAIALFLGRSKKPAPVGNSPDVTSGTASGTARDRGCAAQPRRGAARGARPVT